MQRYIGWDKPYEHIPSLADVAAAERHYADECRRIAAAIAPWDRDECAALALEADVCEMWAAELESESALAMAEYESAIAEFRAAQFGEATPRGGIRILLETHVSALERTL